MPAISASPSPSHPCRRGFTLVELLVVITIIGILIALLLPAVQSARSAARRLKCQNNLKQVALGLLNYHTANSIFPPAVIMDATALDQYWRSPYSHEAYGMNWAIMILPYLEQQGLYDQFASHQYTTDPACEDARGTRLEIFLCPSDPNNRTPFDGTATTGEAGNWARGNYAANATIGHMNRTGFGVNSGALPDSSCWVRNCGRGVMGANASIGIQEMRDGTSNTVLLAEVRAGLSAIDPRGCWALAGPASSLWAHGSSYHGDANGPNCARWGGDNFPSCPELVDQFGDQKLLEMRMHCYSNANAVPFNQQGARSMHRGGVYAALADGSVHFISDFIETKGNACGSPPNPSVWDRLILSADSEAVPAEAF